MHVHLYIYTSWDIANLIWNFGVSENQLYPQMAISEWGSNDQPWDFNALGVPYSK